MSLPKCRDEWRAKCAHDPIGGYGGQCFHFVDQEIRSGRSTMDRHLLRYCARKGEEDARCGCLAPSERVLSSAPQLEAAYGKRACWYAKCHAPDVLLTSVEARDLQRCSVPCTFDDADFAGTAPPACPAQSLGEAVYEPMDLRAVNHQLAFLTRPLFGKG